MRRCIYVFGRQRQEDCHEFSFDASLGYTMRLFFKKKKKKKDSRRPVGSGAELLTDGGEDVGEAEVVHRVEGEQVIEELLLLIIAAQKGITLVQLPVRARHPHINPSQGEGEAKRAHFHKQMVRKQRCQEHCVKAGVQGKSLSRSRSNEITC